MLYKEAIQKLGVDMVDKSLDNPIESDDEDYIMRRIRDENLSDSTVTIFLIGQRSAEALGAHEQRFIKRELQASLYDGENNPRSGILGVVLPSMTQAVFRGSGGCSGCREHIGIVHANDSTMIKEFHKNYYTKDDQCHHGEDERYCVLVSWDDFIVEPEKYIEQAYAKREHPISQSVRVRP